VVDFSVNDFRAELLAEQQRAQSIFTYVMVAIAAISLLVWRDRNYEHRAGDGARKDARDRHPAVDRRAAPEIL